MPRPNALICTVGTSMFSRQSKLRNLPVQRAVQRLNALLNPADGGAEYQSLKLYCTKDDLMERKIRLDLLCSDSEEGEKAARILEACFRDEFIHISVIRCKDLRDDDARIFSTRGLRSLGIFAGNRRHGRIQAADSLCRSGWTGNAGSGLLPVSGFSRSNKASAASNFGGSSSVV